VNSKGALGKALAAVLITYVIAISSLADYLAHQCGRFWFDYTFQVSVTSKGAWVFVALGVLVFVICLFRHVGQAVHWWFWIALAVLVLVANGAYAQTAPVGQFNAAGGEVQCVVRR
jgi:hypothetical protein